MFEEDAGPSRIKAVAVGGVGASPAEVGEMTPPAAVHYFHTMIVPQLGQKLTFRAHRELRTLCTVLDLLARKQPAHAADLVGQRVKAIEKSCHDGHWAAAQYLELLGPDGGGLLERGEEVFMNREHLLGLKLKGWQRKRSQGERRKEREGQGKRKRRKQRQGQEGLVAEEKKEASPEPKGSWTGRHSWEKGGHRSTS